MELTLIRDTFLPDRTLGKLYLNDAFQCFTLEDVVRPEGAPKVSGRTAIPYGTYDLIINKSIRFSAKAGHDVLLPLLLNVPNFEGVRIHAGNGPDDTEGCILVGTEISPDKRLLKSRVALYPLLDELSHIILDFNKVKITIKKDVVQHEKVA